ncbi:MAG: DUF934 domain-containing protein [Undibacterium sp.]|nr:DUF934 domain-containing protein [Undibacterium sp.]
MRQIIRDRAIVTDDWEILQLSEDDNAESIAVPEGKVIIPLKVWQSQRAELVARKDVAVWFSSNEQGKELGDDIHHFALIAIDFPKFADGRGYSIAYNLRTRFGYTGELRAIGDVLRDQLFYMQRVGFNSFAVRADKDINDALKGLSDFSESYQTSVDEKQPLFRRTERTIA